jgi:hypothetical protein
VFDQFGIFTFENYLGHIRREGPGWQIDITLFGRFVGNRTVVIYAVESRWDPHDDRPYEDLNTYLLELVKSYRSKLLTGDQFRIVFGSQRPRIGAVIWGWGTIRSLQRLTFGTPPGRRAATHSHPTLADMEQALRDLKKDFPKWPPKQKFLEMLARSHDDPRRVDEWLKPHGLNYSALVQRIYHP